MYLKLNQYKVNDLVRNPEKFKGTKVKYEGRVYSYGEENDSSIKFLCTMASTSIGEQGLVCIECPKKVLNNQNLIIHDYLKLRGEFIGEYKYRTNGNTANVVPHIFVEDLENKGHFQKYVFKILGLAFIPFIFIVYFMYLLF